MPRNAQFMLLISLTLVSGTTLAHIGDHHAMNFSALVTHFFTQPVHLLWLLPLALLFITRRYNVKKPAKHDDK